MTDIISHPELNSFPVANTDMQRFVIALPTLERNQESALKVELSPGKVLETDGVNKVWLGLYIEEKTLETNGYSYYKIAGSDNVMSTRMGILPGVSPITRFVAGKSLLIPYNSRLPIVIYAAKNFSLKYRLWRGDESFEEVNQG